jgi:4-hydroxy-4-methyl-2-oxoglutarate aldolase
LQGKVGFRINYDWERPVPELLAAFGSASSSQIADCMSRFGAIDAAIRPVWKAPRVIGPALTVWARSADNLMMHKALSLAREGDILVVNTQGNRINAGFGELMANTAVRVGIRAVVVDGVVRDATELEALGLPVYSRGLSPNGCDKNGPGEIGTVIACGGVAIRPGDVVVADEDGVTVVPLADAPGVAGLSVAKVESEKRRVAEIASGVLFKGEIDELLRAKGVID